MAFVSQIQDFGAEIVRRLHKAVTFDGMTSQMWIRCALVVCTYLIIRPWLVKLGAKVTEQEYDNMETRDKERMAKQKEDTEKEQAVNALRGIKPAAHEVGTTTATQDVEKGSQSLLERARHRAKAAAEAQKMVEEDQRAARLENWDEDEEFLANFAKASDRSHGKKQ